jgi:hypothetical protein
MGLFGTSTLDIRNGKDELQWASVFCEVKWSELKILRLGGRRRHLELKLLRDVNAMSKLGGSILLIFENALAMYISGMFF